MQSGSIFFVPLGEETALNPKAKKESPRRLHPELGKETWRRVLAPIGLAGGGPGAAGVNMQVTVEGWRLTDSQQVAVHRKKAESGPFGNYRVPKRMGIIPVKVFSR
jgi:hypothetical protein